jgi:hypothetical protein
VINSLPDNPILVTPISHEYSMFMLILFNWMKNLESSHTWPALEYPLIPQAIQVLDKYTEGCSDYRLSEVYRATAEVVASDLLQSTCDLLQLSSVLTPQGGTEARSQLMNQIRHFEAPEPPNDEPNIRLPEESRSEVLELFNFESNVALRDEAEDDLDRQGNEEAEENPRIDEEHGVFGDVMDDPAPPTSEDPPITALSHPETCDRLSIRANVALNRFADQYQLTDARRRELMRAFDNYVSAVKAELRLSKSGDGQQYTWRTAEVGDPGQESAETGHYVGLPNIALRLERALCSEAPSERTLGQQRRVPSPPRMRMKPNLLLVHTRLEESGHGHRT